MYIFLQTGAISYKMWIFHILEDLYACLCFARTRVSNTSVHVPPYLAFVTGPGDHTLVLMVVLEALVTLSSLSSLSSYVNRVAGTERSCAGLQYYVGSCEAVSLLTPTVCESVVPFLNKSFPLLWFPL